MLTAQEQERMADLKECIKAHIIDIVKHEPLLPSEVGWIAQACPLTTDAMRQLSDYLKLANRRA